ncbi:MAG: inositol monophosphatase family protein [Phycisphaerales bacterium]
MTSPKNELKARLDFASANIMPCAKLSLKWFNNASLTADHKSDGSPVTIADKAIETEIRSRISRAFPDDAILGEEFDDKPGTNEYKWVIDPIDGTISFVQGIPLYGTMLACLHNDTPVLGAIAMPCLDEMIYGATGLGAFHQNKLETPTKAQVSTTSKLNQALISTTSLTYYDTPELRHLYEQLDNASKHTRGFPDCYAIVLLATGRIDAVIEPNVQIWDIASVPPIISEAGGISTDMHGNATVDSNAIVASAPELHPHLIALTKSAIS